MDVFIEKRIRQRKNDYKRIYGLSWEKYEALLRGQNHKCHFCGALHLDEVPLHVDHNHETGAVRGLLCRSCNNCLGGYEKLVKKIGIGRIERYLKGPALAGARFYVRLRTWAKKDGSVGKAWLVDARFPRGDRIWRQFRTEHDAKSFVDAGKGTPNELR